MNKPGVSVLGSGSTAGNSDAIVNVENFTGGADTITGDASGNVLNGRAGADVINGKGGIDTLTGGAGNDTFVFAANDGNDTITDFTIGQDQIELDGFFTSNVDPNFTAFLANLQGQANGVTTISDSHLPGVTITLANVNVNQLHASDFVVHN